MPGVSRLPVAPTGTVQYITVQAVLGTSQPGCTMCSLELAHTLSRLYGARHSMDQTMVCERSFHMIVSSSDQLQGIV